MTDNASNWNALWMDAQRKYWDAWLDLSRQTEKAEPPKADPFSEAFDFWAKLMAQAAPLQSRDWTQKLTDINKGYLRFGEQFMKGLSSGSDFASLPAWWNWMGESLKGAQGGGASPFAPGKDPWAGFATFWGMPLDNWRRVYSAYSVMPGDFEKALRGFAQPGVQVTPESLISRLLSSPTLGYTREWQEEMQKWGQLSLEHAEVLREYGSLLAGANTKASELMGGKLKKMAEEAKLPESLRAFYDLWVDCGEEAYAEVAMSPEFAKVQARLTNTLMAVKRQEQKMVDEVLSALNMPTRRELDTSHRRVHQLQRQVWRLQDEFNEAGILELRQEVMALRREVESLRGKEPAASAEPRRPARKTRQSAES